MLHDCLKLWYNCCMKSKPNVGRKAVDIVSRLFILFAIFVVAVIAFAYFHPKHPTVKLPTAPVHTVAPTQSPDVYGLFTLTNQERVKAGLPELVLDDSLNKSAADKCADMVAKNYWAHNAPDGTTPWVFIQKYIPIYVHEGENLEYSNSTDSAIMLAWMNSTEHRDNILDKHYVGVGFAVCHSTAYINRGPQYIIVQHFIER